MPSTNNTGYGGRQTESEQSQDNLAAALDYARRGFEIFPCRFGTNDPLTEHGHKDATTDEDTIRAWWKRWPRAVIGWRIPQGYVAVDLDFRIDTNGEVKKDGRAALEDAVGEGGIPPTPFAARSGGGGEHLIYRVPAGQVALSTTDINKLKGVDTRANTGYIIIAPSGHKSGNRYAWAETVSGTATLEDLLGGVPNAPLAVLQSPGDRARRQREKITELNDEITAQLREALGFIDPTEKGGTDYDRWVKIGMALSAYTGGSDAALALWHEWSAKDRARYHSGVLESKWDGFHGDGIGISYLLRQARDAGWTGTLNDAFTRRPRGGRPAGGEDDEPEYSHIDAAGDFAGLYGAQAGGRDDHTGEEGEAAGEPPQRREALRYCGLLGGWQWWNGSHWERDTALNALRLMARLMKSKQDQFPADRAKLGSVRFGEGALRYASSRKDFAVSEDVFDLDDFTLATPDGLVNLRTGELGPHDPASMVSRCTSVSPAARADCPTWLSFIAYAMNDDPELIRFLQQWAGLALSGDVSEHVFAFFHGGGGNGKGTFLNAVLAIMGSYGAQINAATLMSGASDRHLTEVASLRGVRFAVAPEVTEGKAWDEERIKTMSGGDKMRARFMRQDEFEFQPKFKITISGNHQPILRNVDEAMKRRLRIVPFVRVPKVKDRRLPDKLKAEYPAILRWMLDGFLDWQENGLIFPQAMRKATEQYFSDQDVFGEWLREACDQDTTKPDWTATTEELLQSYNTFLAAEGERPTTARRMAEKLRRAGAVPYRTSKARGWARIKLKPLTDNFQ